MERIRIGVRGGVRERRGDIGGFRVGIGGVKAC